MLKLLKVALPLESVFCVTVPLNVPIYPNTAGLSYYDIIVIYDDAANHN